MARPTTGIAYFTLGAVILGGLVFTVFVVVPSWAGLAVTRQQHAAKLLERDERREFLANVGARTADLKAHDVDARALAVALPESLAYPDLYAVLHTLASRAGLTIEDVTHPELRKMGGGSLAAGDEQGADRAGGAPSFALAPAGSSGGVSAYEYTVSARGTYAQVRAFVADLERSLRLFDVISVDLTGARETPGAVSAKITLVTSVVQPPR